MINFYLPPEKTARMQAKDISCIFEKNSSSIGEIFIVRESELGCIKEETLDSFLNKEENRAKGAQQIAGTLFNQDLGLALFYDGFYYYTKNHNYVEDILNYMMGVKLVNIV